MKKLNKKKTTTVQFRVSFNSPAVEKMSNIVSHFDLGIDSLKSTDSYIITLETTTKVDKKYENKLRKEITKFYQLQGGRILSLERIKSK